MWAGGWDINSFRRFKSVRECRGNLLTEGQRVLDAMDTDMLLWRKNGAQKRIRQSQQIISFPGKCLFICIIEAADVILHT